MLQLIGRSSSHFTRVAAMFAHELGVPYELVAVHDITSSDSQVFAGNPALKLPSLRTESGLVFGCENICRKLARLSTRPRRIVWPEQEEDDEARNAHELLWHAMAAQVQWVIGTMVAKLPADNVYFAKGRAGFEGALQWLDAHVEAVLRALPPRDLSLFEVALFCLVEHLTFRQSLPVAPYPRLVAFAQTFGQRPSAQATPYRFDAR
ncbi:MAG: glutathione S-transferase family protein [Archangiaceae bacterium]|nr:glutathione S-transferase family protein [Archangiaceae bacterium]